MRLQDLAALLRQGISFPHHHPHEWAHLRPLAERLRMHHVVKPVRPRVAVLAASNAPVRGAWNVQIFHGLGDKAYTLNPLFLQRGRWVKTRTAANLAWSLIGARGPFLTPPTTFSPKRCRYQQLNAYGPRWADLLSARVRDVDITHFGHVALNELEGLTGDSHGPIVWLPTWDNRRYLGGVNQSSLEPMAEAVMNLARNGQNVLVKFHPLTVSHAQAARTRRLLASTPNIEVAPESASAYQLLEGAKAVLTDTSSVGFEAYALGLPVGLALNPEFRPEGLHQELADRAPHVDAQCLADWAEMPERPGDEAWARDLCYLPRVSRNNAFAMDLKRRAET